MGPRSSTTDGLIIILLQILVPEGLGVLVFRAKFDLC